MIELLCPICNNPLIHKNNLYSCGTHNYDLARSGYLNLLPPNKKKSLSPGDNKEMFQARKKVLENGYYKKLENALIEAIRELSPKTLLDVGCGEGTLTKSFSHFVEQCFGVDISKEGILKASKQDKQSFYIVASANRLPFSDNSIDVVVNCFAPINGKEIKRILKRDGVILKVTPAPYHLIELKEKVYPKVYFNPSPTCIDGFYEKERFIVEEKRVYSKEMAQNIFMMTPYYYKTPKEYLGKIDSQLEITTSFNIQVFAI